MNIERQKRLRSEEGYNDSKSNNNATHNLKYNKSKIESKNNSKKQKFISNRDYNDLQEELTFNDATEIISSFNSSNIDLIIKNLQSINNLLIATIKARNDHDQIKIFEQNMRLIVECDDNSNHFSFLFELWDKFPEVFILLFIIP
ncbi:hypothetical protein AYI70_g1284 [Smittium culicis]|uniref:Uncharacterized protein n=1 Tax=Smittium culicis TaxID=133412 RepID=A0A1R1YDV2_9FUNG|nr:hypothetical protein AYI70_g1284 [Smittium culicis]